MKLLPPNLLAYVSFLVSVVWLGIEVAMRLSPIPKFDDIGHLHELERLDPAIGSQIAIPGVPQTGRVALIWLGICSSCSLHSLSVEKLKEACPPATKIFLLVNGASDPKSIELPNKSIVIPQPMIKKMNTYFAPRIYVLQNGRLVKAQQFGSSAYDAIGRFP